MSEENQLNSEEDDVLQARLSAWFKVLHRLAHLQSSDPFAQAWVTTPIPEAIAQLVSAGKIMIIESNDQGIDAASAQKVRLVLRPEGWDYYDMFCQDFAANGQPIQGWTPGRHRAWTSGVTKRESQPWFTTYNPYFTPQVNTFCFDPFHNEKFPAHSPWEDHFIVAHEGIAAHALAAGLDSVGAYIKERIRAAAAEDLVRQIVH